MNLRIITLLLSLAPCLVFAVDWRYDIETDDFKDTVIHKAVYNDMNVSAVIRCKNDELDIILGVNEYLGRDYTDVRVRFDKGEIYEYKWDLSTTGKAVFTRADAFLELEKGFESADEMLIEVTKYTGTKFQRKISLKGISEPLNKVLDACPIINNHITQAEFDEITAGVPAEIKKENYKDKGPKGVKCAKEMLVSLGYPLKDMGPKWTKEYFQQLLTFSKSNPYVDDYKLTSPYSLASEKYPEFVKKCGYLRGFE